MSKKPNPYPRALITTCCLLGFLGLLGSPLRAAELTWDANTDAAGLQDGSGDWNTTNANRWFNGATHQSWVNSAENIAVFGVGDGAAGTVTLTEAITAGGLIFKTPGTATTYTIASSSAANTLTLAGTTPTVRADVAATISAVLAGANGMIKTGAGTLTLGGSTANLLTGSVEVREGTLALSKTSGNALLGDVLINGGTLQWINAHQIADTATVTMTSGVLWIGGKTETFKSLFIQGGASNGGSSSNGGQLTLTDTLGLSESGTLGMNSGGRWSANALTITGSARTALSMTGNSNTQITRFTVGQGGLSMTGQTISLNKGTAAVPPATSTPQGSEIVLNGNVTTSGANTISAGGTGSGVARINLNDNIIIWDVAAPVATEITNVAVAIVSDGGLTKTGAGTLAFGGSDSNTYTGVTTIENGTLRLSKSGGATAINGDIVLTGGVLDWDQSNQLADHVSLTLAGGSLKFDTFTEVFANLTQTSGTTNLGGGSNNGVITITDTLRVSGGTGININSGGTWSANKVDFTGYSGTPLGLNGNRNDRVTRFAVGSGGLFMDGQNISLNKGSAGAMGSDLILNGDVTASGTNNFNAPGSGGTVAEINLGSEIRTWNITSGTTSIAANLIGAGGGIRKTGGGVMAINAAATYTGKTTVESGTLRIGTADGSIDDSPWLEVGAAATFFNNTGSAYVFDGVLSGTGTLNGNMTLGDNRGAVAGNGLLKPGGSSDAASLSTAGNQIGTLSFGGNLDLSGPTSPAIRIVRAELQIGGATGNAASTFADDVATWIANIPVEHASLVGGTPGNHDHLEVAGTLTLHGGGAIEVTNADTGYVPAFGDVFNLIDWGGLSNQGFNVQTDLRLPDISGSGFTWNTSLFLSHGAIVVVPEPGRALLLALGLVGLLMRRRR